MAELLQSRAEEKTQETSTTAASLKSILAMLEENKKETAALRNELKQLKQAKTQSTTGAPKNNANAAAGAGSGTGHALNSAGQSVPTKTNRFGEQYFVQKQKCEHCNKEVSHLPADCLSLPVDAHKVEMRKKWRENNPWATVPRRRARQGAAGAKKE